MFVKSIDSDYNSNNNNDNDNNNNNNNDNNNNNNTCQYRLLHMIVLSMKKYIVIEQSGSRICSGLHGSSQN